MSRSRADFDDLPELTVLLDRAVDGDREATEEFTTLVLSHIHELVRNTRRKFPGIRWLESTDADTNEVFLRMLIRPRSDKRKFSSRKEFLGACFTTAYRLLIDRLRSYERHRAKSQEREESRGPTEAVNPAPAAETTEQIEMINLALNELEEEEFTLVCLIHFLGFSQRKAFEIMELPESSGRDRVKRVMARLGAAMRANRSLPE